MKTLLLILFVLILSACSGSKELTKEQEKTTSELVSSSKPKLENFSVQSEVTEGTEVALQWWFSNAVSVYFPQNRSFYKASDKISFLLKESKTLQLIATNAKGDTSVHSFFVKVIPRQVTPDTYTIKGPVNSKKISYPIAKSTIESNFISGMIDFTESKIEQLFIRNIVAEDSMLIITVLPLDKNGNFIDDNESDKIGGIPTNIWQNPDSTFLDPANGIGNFPIIAFYKLDYELKKRPKFKDSAKRKKHIIEKMLFMIEIDKGNCQTTRAIFKKICPEAKPNICCKNTLTVTDAILKNTFGINRFTVIMGNPPYQPSQLWEQFIKKSILFLNTDSYFIFIIPSSWTSPTSDSWNILKKKNIIIINSSLYLKELYFKKIGSTFSYFLIKNEIYKNVTISIYDINKYFSFNINSVFMLPNLISPLSISINNKVLINKLSGDFIRKDLGNYQKILNDEYKYPVITFVKPNNILDIQYRYRQDPQEKQKKVLLFRSGYINPYFDNGINGVGDNIHSLSVKTSSQGNNIVKLFKSQLYNYIWKINKHSQFNWSGLMNNVFRNVLNIKEYDDISIYKYFNISKSEILYINSFIKLKSNKTNTIKHSEGGSYNKFNKTRKNKK